MNHNVQSHIRSAPSVRRRAASAAAWPADVDDRRADADRGHTPHIPGAAVCLCAACHLKLSRFPRRQDGRIVLPDPLAARSELAPAGATFLPPVRVRTRSNVHVDGNRVQDDRRELVARDLRDDRGEGPSTGDGDFVSRSGTPMSILDSRPHHLDVLQEADAPMSGDQLPHAASAALGTTRNRQSSLTDRSRPRRAPKPYEPKPISPLEATPRHPGKAYPGQQHLPTAYEDVTSHQSAVSLGIRESNVSSSSTLSHNRTHSESYHNAVPNPKLKAHIPNPNLGNSRPSSAQSSQYRPPSLASSQSNLQTTTTNTNSYFIDAAGLEQPSPKVIRFNSRPRNPQPEVWSHTNTQPGDETQNTDSPPDLRYYEGEIQSNSSSVYGVLPTGMTGPAGEGPNSQPRPSSASHQRQQHYYQHQQPASSSMQQQQQEYQYQAHLPSQDSAPPLRFQNPVTPQIHVANTTRAAAGKPRALSVVHVKWDSERKRRQGYFAAQDDGEEKSPFRHYNKTGCDYDS